MAGNPQIPLGTLNRLLTSITFASFPQLNITPAFLGKRSVHIAPQGDLTQNLQALTGIVPSPEPYVMYRGTVSLLKSQPFSALFKAQIESNSYLGTATVRGDSSVLTPYQLYNVSIMSTPDLSFAGDDPDFTFMLEGTYYVNSSLWQ